MGPRAAKMSQNVGVGATHLFQSVAEYGKASGVKRPRWQGAVVVGGVGKGDDI
jgi:hypothetical protein